MDSRLIFLGTDEHIEEAFLMLAHQDGSMSWHHWDFSKVEFDDALNQIVQTKQEAGIDEVFATCAVRSELDEPPWPDFSQN